MNLEYGRCVAAALAEVVAVLALGNNFLTLLAPEAERQQRLRQLTAGL